MMSVLSIAASALLSGLIATWVTLVYTQKKGKRRAKVALFQQLVGTRNVLLPGPHDSTAAMIVISAFNQIFLLFHDAPAVLGSLKAFHEVILDPNGSQDLKNQRLLELFKAVAKHLDINTEPLGEGFFMRAFSVNSLIGPQPLNMSVNGIRLQDGTPVLFGFQDLGGGQRVPLFIPVGISDAIGAMLLELAAIARERDPALRTTGVIDLGSVPDLQQRFERRRAMNA